MLQACMSNLSDLAEKFRESGMSESVTDGLAAMSGSTIVAFVALIAIVGVAIYWVYRNFFGR